MFLLCCLFIRAPFYVLLVFVCMCSVFHLLHCTLSCAVYCNRPFLYICLCVCLFICLWVHLTTASAQCLHRLWAFFMRPSSLGGAAYCVALCLSVCLSVCPSVPLSSVTWRHLANYNDTHVLFVTRWGLHIVRPSRPHKFLFSFWLSCHYLPNDWLERPLLRSLTVARGSSP